MCGDKITVICNQENFVLHGNAYKIKQALPNGHVILKEAIKATLDNGKPANGMFITLPDAYMSCIQDVSSSHWHIQAAP